MEPRKQSLDFSTLRGIDEYLVNEGIDIGVVKGRQQGRQEGQSKVRAIIENLLAETDFNNQKIAALTHVTIDFVVQMRKRYEIGLELDRLEIRQEFVERMVLKSDLDDEKIAGIVDVSIDFVRQMRTGAKKA